MDNQNIDKVFERIFHTTMEDVKTIYASHGVPDDFNKSIVTGILVGSVLLAIDDIKPQNKPETKLMRELRDHADLTSVQRDVHDLLYLGLKVMELPMLQTYAAWLGTEINGMRTEDKTLRDAIDEAFELIQNRAKLNTARKSKDLRDFIETVSVRESEHMMLGKDKQGSGWIFYGLDKDGVARGGFRYQSVGAAKYSWENQQHVCWAHPPLDFAWDKNICDREYDIEVLTLLCTVTRDGEILLDKRIPSHALLLTCLEDSHPQSIHALTKHVEGTIDAHIKPDKVS